MGQIQESGEIMSSNQFIAVHSRIVSLREQIGQMDTVGTPSTNLEIFNSMDAILEIQGQILSLLHMSLSARIDPDQAAQTLQAPA